jgi:hypothetical protein
MVSDRRSNDGDTRVSTKTVLILAAAVMAAAAFLPATASASFTGPAIAVGQSAGAELQQVYHRRYYHRRHYYGHYRHRPYRYRPRYHSYSYGY